MIRCGGIQTSSVLRTSDELAESFSRWPRERLALYEERLRNWRADMVGFDAKRTPPEAVARVVFRALAAVRPRRRYRIGYMSGAAAFLESLPQPLADWILKMRF